MTGVYNFDLLSITSTTEQTGHLHMTFN